MAHPENRFAENSPGRFYVDDQCIDCDLCRERLPGVFARSDEGGHSYVTCQPQSPAEIEEALLALEDCPAEAIGSDGLIAAASCGGA